jgi:hypothetical protein
MKIKAAADGQYVQAVARLADTLRASGDDPNRGRDHPRRHARNDVSSAMRLKVASKRF